MVKNKEKRVEADRNEDLITGEPGSHPVGTGLGTAAGGAAAGAAAGAVAGPVGAVAGAVVGGVAGAFAGKSIAEHIDPTVEASYWQDEYKNRPYHDADADYEKTYGPAYQNGWEGREKYDNAANFEAAEADLRSDWEANKENDSLSWDKAKHASRDAWNRVEQNLPGDIDNDSK